MIAPEPHPTPHPASPACPHGRSNKAVQLSQLLSSNRRCQLLVQGDRNIVLLRNGKAVWTSNTATTAAAGTYQLVLRPTGELVGVQQGSGAPFWSTRTAGLGKAPYTLAVQNNCGVVLYDSRGQPLWSTSTAIPAALPFFKRCATPAWEAGCHPWVASCPLRAPLQVLASAARRKDACGASWLQHGARWCTLGTPAASPNAPGQRSPPRRSWAAVGSSANGRVLSAVVKGGAWWRSSDAGRTWSSDGSKRDWVAVAVSGERLPTGSAALPAAPGSPCTIMSAPMPRCWACSRWQRPVRGGAGRQHLCYCQWRGECRCCWRAGPPAVDVPRLFYLRCGVGRQKGSLDRTCGCTPGCQRGAQSASLVKAPLGGMRLPLCPCR